MHGECRSVNGGASQRPAKSTDKGLHMSSETHAFNQLGLVGSGVMGLGIAQIAVLAGMPVRLLDARPGAASDGVQRLLSTLDALAAKGRVSAEQLAFARQALQPVHTLAELAGCDLLVEAIVEDLPAKQALMRELETVVSPQAVLATNTSSLSVTAIASGLQHPGRVAGFHFFNPVPLMKIVEVIGGARTEPAVVQALLALGQRMGHTAVQAQDTPGFIVNHAGRGYGTESLRLLAEQVGTLEDIDRVLRDTAGFRLGPFELMDLTGLDVSHPVMESIYHQYYEEPRFRPQGITRQRLTAGLLGRKSGQGFYRHVDGQVLRSPETPTGAERPARVWVSQDEASGAERAVALLGSLGAVLDTGAKPGPDSLCVVTPMGHDVSTLVNRQGLPPERTVGLCTLFDTHKRRVLMASPATTPAALAQARGLLGHNGVPVTVLQDSAGMVSARVVSTIVNIACEMAQQGIARPADIDKAVQLGLGYPFGPLAWGDRLGAARVLQVLDELHVSTGDMRYRASPWLRRRALLGIGLTESSRTA
jgi:3-hydroxybutyryl-CoA dehydrogenase